MSKADKELQDWFDANKSNLDANGSPVGLAEACAKYVQEKRKETICH